jgi:hypothetical protein
MPPCFTTCLEILREKVTRDYQKSTIELNHSNHHIDSVILADLKETGVLVSLVRSEGHSLPKAVRKVHSNPGSTTAG